jgi:hypothetical protein
MESFIYRRRGVARLRVGTPKYLATSPSILVTSFSGASSRGWTTVTHRKNGRFVSSAR